MRNLLLGLLSVGACNWTEFNDLKDETWVTSIEKPDNDSSNWGVAISRTQRSGAGGGLAVIGASQALFNELALGSPGDITVKANELELNSQFGLGNLEAQPTLIADAGSTAIALVTASGDATVVLHGIDGNLDAYQVFGPDRVDGATWLTPPKRSDATMALPPQVIVAKDDLVKGAHFDDVEQPTSMAIPDCKLVDEGAAAVNVRALGSYRPDGQAYDNLVVWSSTGKLYLYDGRVFNGTADAGITCAAQPPLAVTPADTTFKPQAAAQILTFETKDASNVVTGRYALLQGHDDTNGFLALYDLATLTQIGSPRSDGGLKTAALAEIDGKRYVIGGFPGTVIDGVSCGQAQVFEVSTTSGIAGEAALTLRDAQPDDDQSFGRSVAAVPYNDKVIFAVAADNEIFFYFRSTLYAETRSTGG